jgi:type IV pilus assembly protein PilN
MLDQLVRTVPDGVFYTDLRTTNQVIYITGIAESNNRVSSLMRRLNASDWFSEPNLEGVRAEPGFGEQATTFNMTVRLQLPSAGEEEG